MFSDVRVTGTGSGRRGCPVSGGERGHVILKRGGVSSGDYGANGYSVFVHV